MMDSLSALVQVTIRIGPSASHSFDSVVAELQKSGLVKLELHRRFYIVNGMILESELDKLKKIPGIVSVRKDQIYHTNS